MKGTNMNSLENLYSVILDRKENPQEGSYTCYLFEKGLDKILKKVGEESAETSGNGRSAHTLSQHLSFFLVALRGAVGVSGLQSG